MNRNRVPQESATIVTKRTTKSGFRKYGLTFSSVTPVKAGVQESWIPASAGMTKDDADKLCMCGRTYETAH